MDPVDLFKMFNAGLPTEANMPINWCPSCLTGLANEEVVCGGMRTLQYYGCIREIPQWVFKITDYAEKLLEGLDRLNGQKK